MRTLHRTWRNAPGGCWARRVRWYSMADHLLGHNHRLVFEDAAGTVQRFYRTVTEAQADYDAFRWDLASVASLRREREKVA